MARTIVMANAGLSEPPPADDPRVRETASLGFDEVRRRHKLATAVLRRKLDRALRQRRYTR
jgi:hypothetical protein